MTAPGPSPGGHLVRALGVVLVCACPAFFTVSYLWVADSTAPNPLWFTVGSWLALGSLTIGVALLAASSWRRRRSARGT